MKKLYPTLRDFSLITLGAFIQAVGLRLFLIPANLASGGVSGISQLINHGTGWPIGVMVLVGNIPLFALGWRFLGGRKFIIRTAFAVATFSFLVDALTLILPPEGITDDILLNSLYGALVSGIGYGIVYRGQGTSGGSDILARILNRWRGIPISQSYLMVDSAVILTAGFVFGWKEALYALITLYVSGIVTETASQGLSVVRTAMIITSEPELVSEQIFQTLDRGVTLLPGKGAYTGVERTILYCVVTRPETMRLKRIVNEADPDAFMVIGQAHEALGEGFAPLNEV
ncbi:MAG: YitT family protein [Anaerolineales bacterium]|uniref:YitT family protein n=1 Tax=Candidatus Desulfolinea nitratireducens TaxID=2841698 RepID=A0A8J6NGW0_9CHLR|nr:YitT family protein [Candidatus Desulfolinea nitratireducens]MBL6960729.1 YitT family protein [Anaerolineales bacterium]